jgi:hypothetical protein
MSEFADFFYYALLKRGKILTVILGIIIFIMVFTYFANWGTGFKEITSNSLKNCNSDSECFSWCEECVSLASTQYCEPKYQPCVCNEGLCASP